MTPRYIKDLASLLIIQRVHKISRKGLFLHMTIPTVKPTFFECRYHDLSEGSWLVKHKRGLSPIPAQPIDEENAWVNKWKVIAPALIENEVTYPKKILGPVEYLPPGCSCTKHYMVLGLFNREQEAESLTIYLRSRFARFLVSRLSRGMYLNKSAFRLVPEQDYSKIWYDSLLYRRYGLTTEEIDLIQQRVTEYS